MNLAPRMPYSWANLPGGLDQEVFEKFKTLSCREKFKIAAVCKSWRKQMEQPEMGHMHLQDLGLKPQDTRTWLELVGKYLLSSPCMIAVDVSPSMSERPRNGRGFNNFELALKKCSLIIQSLGKDVEIHGVDCIAFAVNVRALKVFSEKEALNFFHEYRSRLGGGTSLSQAISEIAQKHEKYQALNRCGRAAAHIISDFEDRFDQEMERVIFDNRERGMDLNCFWLPGTDIAQAGQLRDSLQNSIKPDGNQEPEEGPKVRTRAAKRKRDQAKGLDIDFTQVNLKEFGRQEKKIKP